MAEKGQKCYAGAMRIYLINLDRRPDRLAAMTQRAGALGLGVVFDAGAPWAGAVADHLAPWDNERLIATLEDNRLRNYLAAIEAERRAA